MKIWSLPKHENLTTCKIYCGKEEKLLLRSNFSPFPQYFQYISNFKSPDIHIFVKCVLSNYFFLNSANLICRSTDISKFFRESLGIRDNGSRLYLHIFYMKYATISTSLNLNVISFLPFTSMSIKKCLSTIKKHAERERENRTSSM